ncbi:unnamed protein product (mitochondrion) [Plasmodiophora brassicae]|uniref:Far11/STRP C-terminal domain-containing protein n=1 Tax=Plasmodiophora brassicae TaxID=37360 RepID=A0A3P3YM73_PLABS|nr:unnamed protein product [Plasmodiophora brassicae]
MSDGVGSKLSMRIPARSSLRRGSTALTALDGGAGSLFARADWDEVAEEIGEVFSLSESIDLINGRRLITELDERLDLDRVLQDIRSKDQLQRLYSGDILLSLLVGGQLPPEASRSERLGNAGRIARQVVDSGAYHSILQNLGRAVAAIHRPDTLVSAPPSFWTDSKEIRLHFNIVLVVLITLREVHLANSQIAGKTLVEFGLDLVASDQCDLYPLKKVLQLIRLSLLITFGDISSAQFDRPGYLTQSKARRRDVFKVCKHISECFGPVLCIPNPVHESGIELVTFSNTPRALAHRATYLRSCVHLGYSDMEDYVDLASGGHAERPETSSEALYRTLQTNLRQSVVALLKILLSVAPSVRPSAQMVNSDNEFIIAPGLTSLGETLERARHTEIITKSIAFILLALLKCFRRGHPLQFCSLLCLLQDKNALVLILKFLNQNVSGSLMKRNDVDSMSPFSEEMWKMQDMDTVLESISNAAPLQGPCWRKYSAYSNLLRVLQKISKNAPRQIRALVKFRAPTILKRLLQIPQLDIILYTLKLFKSLAPYMDRKWRTDHMEVANGVYLRIRMDVMDDWLDLTAADGDALEREISVAKAIRQACQQFNANRYQQPVVSPIYLLPPNAGEDEILEAALQEHRVALSPEFKACWRQWLLEEVPNAVV